MLQEPGKAFANQIGVESSPRPQCLPPGWHWLRKIMHT
jgi:hypothetical protein